MNVEMCFICPQSLCLVAAVEFKNKLYLSTCQKLSTCSTSFIQALKLLSVRAEMSHRFHLVYHKLPIPLTLRIL